jgi:hypothetical protein
MGASEIPYYLFLRTIPAMSKKIQIAVLVIVCVTLVGLALHFWLQYSSKEAKIKRQNEQEELDFQRQLKSDSGQYWYNF